MSGDGQTGGAGPGDGDAETDDQAPAGDASFAIRAASFPARKPDPGLHLVSTPIGNLSDITLRALDVIAGADRLACEDKRTTASLLRRYAIRRRTVAYHEHNAIEAGATLLADLEAGLSVALVSDAGTPLVSDPGFPLVREAAARGIPVHSVPGPSAPIAALTASGLPSDSFFFAGFLPAKSAARLVRIAEISRIPGTLLLFEAPHRIADSLADMAEVLGNEREAAVCREMTKAFETIYRGTLETLAAEFARMERVRGEIVVCIAPPKAEAPPSEADADAVLLGLLAEMKPARAAQEAAKLTGLPRRDLYARALALKSPA